MSKKSLERKPAQKLITDAREAGKTDQEIYDELTQVYFDKKAVALLITGTPTRENKEKYKVYNNILLGLLGITVLLKILVVFGLTIETGNLGTLLLAFIVPLMAVFFIYEISRYSAASYRFCGILTIIGFIRTIGKLEDSTEIFLNIIFAGAICGLSFYLDSTLFPNFKPRKLKTDEQGEYILTSSHDN
jgi:hypothetical protein